MTSAGTLRLSQPRAPAGLRLTRDTLEAPVQCEQRFRTWATHLLNTRDWRSTPAGAVVPDSRSQSQYRVTPDVSEPGPSSVFGRLIDGRCAIGPEARRVAQHQTPPSLRRQTSDDTYPLPHVSLYTTGLSAAASLVERLPGSHPIENFHQHACARTWAGRRVPEANEDFPRGRRYL